MEKIKIKKESSDIFVNGNIPISLGLLLCERAATAVAINVSCAIEMKMNKLRSYIYIFGQLIEFSAFI